MATTGCSLERPCVQEQQVRRGGSLWAPIGRAWAGGLSSQGREFWEPSVARAPRHLCGPVQATGGWSGLGLSVSWRPGSGTGAPGTRRPQGEFQLPIGCQSGTWRGWVMVGHLPGQGDVGRGFRREARRGGESRQQQAPGGGMGALEEERCGVEAPFLPQESPAWAAAAGAGQRSAPTLPTGDLNLVFLSHRCWSGVLYCYLEI